MTKALNQPAAKPAPKRRPKAEVLRELDEQTARGQALRDRPVKDELELAWASIEKLSWRMDVLKLLPHMSKGIQAAADFNRAAFPTEVPLGISLDEEVAFFRHVMNAQLAILEKAVERWRKSGTRPL